MPLQLLQSLLQATKAVACSPWFCAGAKCGMQQCSAR
jgi:hypothetical protein